METVIFTEAKSWGIPKGYYTNDYGWNDSTPSDLYFVTHGNQEYVVECSAKVRAQLEALPNDTYLPLKLSAAKKYLDANKIPYTVVK